MIWFAISTCNHCSIILLKTYLHLVHCQDGKREHWGTVVLYQSGLRFQWVYDALRLYGAFGKCSPGQGSTAVNKQTPPPPFFLMSFSERLDNTNSSSLSLSFSLFLRANPLNAVSERESGWWERAWGREGAGKRDVEEREQLVLRADTGHIAKNSAAAYGAVKQPLCLFASLHQLSLPGFSSLCHYRDWACYPAMASQQDSGFFEISIKSLLKSWGSSEYELCTYTHTCTQY